MNTTTMTLITDSTVTVHDVATNPTKVPMIGESTINLVGWVCALVHQDAEFRVYRVEGSTNSSLDADGLATGVRVYKRNITIGEWLLCCWTHGVANNPQMQEPFDSWFKRRTALEPAKKRSERSPTPRVVTRFAPDYPSYPKSAPSTYKPAPRKPDELDGMIGDIGQTVIKKL